MRTGSGIYAVTATNACGQAEDALQADYDTRIDSMVMRPVPIPAAARNLRCPFSRICLLSLAGRQQPASL